MSNMRCNIMFTNSVIHCTQEESLWSKDAGITKLTESQIQVSMYATVK